MRPRRVVRKKTGRPRANPAPVPAERPRVLMIGSEALPFAKTGGLADVLGALPPALARLGWDATVALPKLPRRRRRHHPRTISRDRRRLYPRCRHSRSPAGRRRARGSSTARICSIARRPRTDGTDYPDNALRFAMLVRATLEFAGRQSPRTSVVHAHDWQAGLAPVYRRRYATHPSSAARRVSHDSQPRVSGTVRWRLAAAPRSRLGAVHARSPRDRRRISFLKGGINAAEIVTTVSPRYAQEIQTPALGLASTASCGSAARISSVS